MNIEKKRDERETTFVLLFESMFRGDDEEGINDIIEAAQEVGELDINENTISEFKNILAKSDELDKIIAEYVQNRQFNRIPKIHVAIMRIALYEILYNDKIPTEVAIAEATRIAEKYALKPDVKAINGVLGAYARKNGDEK